MYSVSCFNLVVGLEALFGEKAYQSCPVEMGLGLGSGQVLSNFLWTCTFSISIDEHVPLKFRMTKSLWKITRMLLPISI